jgi:hypothetical protein
MPNRLRRVAIAFKPSTLLKFHRALVQRKYRLLFSPRQRTKPGPKGPDAELIHAVVEMKHRNPTWGCPHIADQINLAFGTSINKDAVVFKITKRLTPDSFHMDAPMRHSHYRLQSWPQRTPRSSTRLGIFVETRAKDHFPSRPYGGPNNRHAASH